MRLAWFSGMTASGETITQRNAISPFQLYNGRKLDAEVWK